MMILVTLCEACRAFYEDSFTVKPLSIATTTEKKILREMREEIQQPL